jgi:hypothetical protein
MSVCVCVCVCVCEEEMKLSIEEVLKKERLELLKNQQK